MYEWGLSNLKPNRSVLFPYGFPLPYRFKILDKKWKEMALSEGVCEYLTHWHLS